MKTIQLLKELDRLDEIEDRTRSHISQYIAGGQYEAVVKLLNDIATHREQLARIVPDDL